MYLCAWADDSVEVKIISNDSILILQCDNSKYRIRGYIDRGKFVVNLGC